MTSSDSAFGTPRPFELWVAVMVFEVVIGISVLTLSFPLTLSLVLILPLLLVAFWKPILGLALIIPFFPNYPFVLFSIGEVRIHPIDPLLIITILCWAVICLKRHELRLDSGPIETALFLLLIWSLISLLWAPSVPRGIVQALKMVKGLTIYYLHVQMIRDKRDFDMVVSTWIVAGVVFSIIGFRELLVYGLEAASKLGHEYERLTREVRTTALFQQPNSLGFFLVLCIVLGIMKYFVTPSRRWKRFLCVALPFMFLVLLSTFSRKSFLSMFLAAMYISLHRKKLFWGLIGVSVGTFLILALLGSGGFTQVMIDRFMTFFQPPGEAIAERVKVWTSAFEVFLASPITGTGLGSSVFYLRLENLSLQTTHNMYLYILAELGLIGLLLFIFVGGQTLFSFHKLGKASLDPSVDLMSKAIIAGFLVILAQAGFKAINLVDPILWGQLGLAGAFLRVYEPSSKVS